MRHRKEEDDLYRKFQRQREEEEKRIRDEIRVSFYALFYFPHNFFWNTLHFYFLQDEQRYQIVNS